MSVAVLVLVTACAGSGDRGFGKDASSGDDSAPQAGLAGAWTRPGSFDGQSWTATLELSEDGGLHAWNDAHPATEVLGDWQAIDDRLLVSDPTCAAADDRDGAYTWALADDHLVLESVFDPCWAREALFVGRWDRLEQ